MAGVYLRMLSVCSANRSAPSAGSSLGLQPHLPGTRHHSRWGLQASQLHLFLPASVLGERGHRAVRLGALGRIYLVASLSFTLCPRGVCWHQRLTADTISRSDKTAPRAEPALSSTELQVAGVLAPGVPSVAMEICGADTTSSGWLLPLRLEDVCRYRERCVKVDRRVCSR